MTVGDFIKRLKLQSEDKVILFKENINKDGWGNIDMFISDSYIFITPDEKSIFENN